MNLTQFVQALMNGAPLEVGMVEDFDPLDLKSTKERLAEFEKVYRQEMPYEPPEFCSESAC